MAIQNTWQKYVLETRRNTKCSAAAAASTITTATTTLLSCVIVILLGCNCDMGVYEEEESIRSANTNNVGTESEGQFEWRHHLRLSLGAQNVVSGGSRTDTSGRRDRRNEANTRFSKLCA